MFVRHGVLFSCSWTIGLCVEYIARITDGRMRHGRDAEDEISSDDSEDLMC